MGFPYGIKTERNVTMPSSLWSRIRIGAASMLLASAFGQTPQQERPPVSEDVFKNIQVLKGIPVNEFLGIMGFFSASLGKSCVDCHDSDAGWENYISDRNPSKKKARAMIAMTAAINKNFFAGQKLLTCYSCHRGGPRPRRTASLAALYSAPPPDEADDTVQTSAGGPPAEEILENYFRAIGGADKWAAIKSYIAKGTNTGYSAEEREKRATEIFASAPGQLTTIIHTDAGDKTTIFDGRNGWIASAHTPVPVLALGGADLSYAKLDAALAFPQRIREVFIKLKVGIPTEIDDRDVQVLQGTTATGELVNFYFDAESSLLVRSVRYVDSPVGRLSTQIDYSDYRDVSGLKIPFRWILTWLDGRDTFEWTSVDLNAPIDPAKFGKPAPAVRK